MYRNEIYLILQASETTNDAKKSSFTSHQSPRNLYHT